MNNPFSIKKLFIFLISTISLEVHTSKGLNADETDIFIGMLIESLR